MMQSNSRNIQFDNVDWAASQKAAAKQTKQISPTRPSRNITPTKELEGGETINLTPPMQPKMQMPPMPPMPKPTHYSPPRILTRQQSPVEKSGLGIQMYDAEKAMDEKRGFDEKRGWEPTQPPPSHYVPYKEFQTVELEKPGYAPSQRSLPPYSQDPNVPRAPEHYYNGHKKRKVPAWLWILFILIFLTIFVGIPLAVFGGVYKWNYGKYRCAKSWGNWHEDNSSCTY